MCRAQLLSIACCMAALSPPAAAAADIRVLATGVYASSLRDLAGPFEAMTGDHLVLTITNAGGVLAKLAAHEDADVVMTASAGIDALVARGDVRPETKFDVARMRLGAAVKSGAALPDLTGEAGFRTALLAAPTVAYIDPKGGGSAGAFFDGMLTRLGLAEAVQAKVVLCATGAEVASAVASGRAAIGLTQASELIDAPGVAFAGFLPEAVNTWTPYAAAVTTTTQDPSAARAFIAFVTGPNGSARLKQAGWDVPPR
ncbi:molybdate ABC transporter substrate-binding protein [Methylobacterium sp. PvR107]|uniref:molybdate ABC transporter substrate-binding protein n=1 Tax=Methylobacterium sp. PvR107 TaxID=2806597 RepID=UPI001AEB8807|nr:substrate-binding domain-containing protein [Methylobacterium sp. PvR107]MBP1178084.1 molybdate transport system substrate-binding protein [Methylobacterium sp. PvR107]